ncbi:Homologous-pairing protein 2 -like protein [Sarcoptes scabiei]|uniref:Homologous-pairing protein 2 homolog n=1 Tax=Sarcoptes scabiei TaxID=52283 RepID=A0A834VB61_SARSC|nr:Homologous-pairing protein 2 -like protein [Sarcoptes scabiei]
MTKNIEEVKYDLKDFLQSNNRPFSLNDLVNQFQTKYNKTILNKALELLTNENLIVEKLNGKQKIYFISQETIVFNEEKMKQIDSKIVEQKLAIKSLEKIYEQKQEQLKSFKNYVPIDVLENDLDQLKAKVSMLREKIEKTRKSNKINDDDDGDGGGDGQSRTKMDIEMLQEKERKLNNEYRKRKRLACSIIDMIMENYPKSKKCFFEEIGIENDDDGEGGDA